VAGFSWQVIGDDESTSARWESPWRQERGWRGLERGGEEGGGPRNIGVGLSGGAGEGVIKSTARSCPIGRLSLQDGLGHFTKRKRVKEIRGRDADKIGD